MASECQTVRATADLVSMLARGMCTRRRKSCKM